MAIGGALTFPGASVLADIPIIPRPDHVVIVVEENRSPNGVVASSHAPYIGSLVTRGALLTEYFGIDHPSQPNYLVLFSGSTQGVSDDSCPHHFTTPNLASELIGAGFTFAGYSESLPFPGATSCEIGPYVRRHAPWINFMNVSPKLHLPFTAFPSDFSQLPTLCFVIPNLNNDMHDGTTEQADAWLERHIDPYVQWAQTHNSLLILTWDEGAAPNQIATILVGPMVQPGAYCGRVNHYHLLRTLEDMFGLPHAGLTANVSPILDVWTAGATPPTVTLAEPGDSAAFVAPTNIVLSAEAISDAGPIQKVEFFAGATKLGEATNSPYTILWRNAAPGTWCLRAKATDMAGGMRSSSNATISITGTASNLFLSAKGIYQGAVSNATNSGTFSLTVNSRGAFSGRLVLSGARIPFHGRFDQAGAAAVTGKRRKQTPLLIDLNLDLFEGSGTVQGVASDNSTAYRLSGTRR